MPSITGLVVTFVIISGITMIHKANKRFQQLAEEERKRTEQEAVRIRQHEAEQEGLRNGILSLSRQSLEIFASMPRHLESTERLLDQSESFFSQRAFAPFWDSIEAAAKKLGHFNEGVNELKGNAVRHTEMVRKYERKPPKLPLAPESVRKLDVGAATAQRMQEIVGQAQRDFQFSMIYEQRKTNQILVAGFTSLAHALNEMTWRITTSINDLASSVDSLASSVDSSTTALQTSLDSIDVTAKEHLALACGVVEGAAARERKALRMLDNIQNRRKPFP